MSRLLLAQTWAPESREQVKQTGNNLLQINFKSHGSKVQEDLLCLVNQGLPAVGVGEPKALKATHDRGEQPGRWPDV